MIMVPPLTALEAQVKELREKGVRIPAIAVAVGRTEAQTWKVWERALGKLRAAGVRKSRTAAYEVRTRTRATKGGA